MPTPRVYQAICNVTEALSKTGIAKGRKNMQQNYNFRGIDDVYNALASELAAHKLCVLPEVLERTYVERATKNGGLLFSVNLKVAFDCVSAEDGSSHRIVTYGEAMDSGDKATNKAQSAAYKYAAFMAFCIPTEGDNDSENQTHEITVIPAKIIKKAAVATAEEIPESGIASVSKIKAKATEFVHQLEMCENAAELQKLLAAHGPLLVDIKNKLPEDWGKRVNDKIDTQAQLLAPQN